MKRASKAIFITKRPLRGREQEHAKMREKYACICISFSLSLDIVYSHVPHSEFFSHEESMTEGGRQASCTTRINIEGAFSDSGGSDGGGAGPGANSGATFVERNATPERGRERQRKKKKRRSDVAAKEFRRSPSISFAEEDEVCMYLLLCDVGMS